MNDEPLGLLIRDEDEDKLRKMLDRADIVDNHGWTGSPDISHKGPQWVIVKVKALTTTANYYDGQIVYPKADRTTTPLRKVWVSTLVTQPLAINSYVAGLISGPKTIGIGGSGSGGSGGSGSGSGSGAGGTTRPVVFVASNGGTTGEFVQVVGAPTGPFYPGIRRIRNGAAATWGYAEQCFVQEANGRPLNLGQNYECDLDPGTVSGKALWDTSDCCAAGCGLCSDTSPTEVCMRISAPDCPGIDGYTQLLTGSNWSFSGSTPFLANIAIACNGLGWVAFGSSNGLTSNGLSCYSALTVGPCPCNADWDSINPGWFCNSYSGPGCPCSSPWNWYFPPISLTGGPSPVQPCQYHGCFGPGQGQSGVCYGSFDAGYSGPEGCYADGTCYVGNPYIGWADCITIAPDTIPTPAFGSGCGGSGGFGSGSGGLGMVERLSLAPSCLPLCLSFPAFLSSTTGMGTCAGQMVTITVTSDLTGCSGIGSGGGGGGGGVATPCCPTNNIPTSLTVTITVVSGTCPGWATSFSIPYGGTSGGSSVWESGFSIGPTPWYCQFICQAGGGTDLFANVFPIGGGGPLVFQDSPTQNCSGFSWSQNATIASCPGAILLVSIS